MSIEDDFNIEDIINGASRNVRKNMKKEEPEDEKKENPAESDKGPKLIKSKDGKSAIIACKTPEEAIEAIKKYGVPDGVLSVGDILNRILQGGDDYGLTKEEDKQLEDLLKPVQEFCDKHGLPALVLVQHYKQGKAIGLKGFRNPEEERMEVRMRFMMRLKDLIYNDVCSMDDLEVIAEVLNRVYKSQEERHG